MLMKMRNILCIHSCLAAMILWSCGSVCAQSSPNPGSVRFAAEVPLLDCDGLPCVEARMGTGPVLKMGIDTGNVDSVLDAPFAEAAGLKPTTALPAGAPSGIFRTVLPSISVGNVTLENVRTLAMSLSDMISQNQ